MALNHVTSILHLSTQTKSTVCHVFMNISACFKWKIKFFVLIKRPLVAEMITCVFKPSFLLCDNGFRLFEPVEIVP